MTSRRRKVSLLVEVLAFVLAVGVVDLAFYRPGLSTGASLGVFAAEVVAGAIVWVAASLLLERRVRWGIALAPNERRRAVVTAVAGCLFFVLLAAAVLLFGWRSMSLVPIVATAFLVWWLLAGLLERSSSLDATRKI